MTVYAEKGLRAGVSPAEVQRLSRRTITSTMPAVRTGWEASILRPSGPSRHIEM
jgi:hypothetical protein